MNLVLQVILGFFALLTSSLGHAYTGYKSSEAALSFDAFVDADQKPNAQEARDLVTDHVQYLFGPMMLSKTMAAPKGDEKTSVTRIEGSRVFYHYTGTLVMQTGPRTSYIVILPNNPHALFVKTDKPAGLNPCTDDHYQSEGDFWYFWSPSRPGCSKLIKEGDDYQVIEATLTRIPNVTHSRPEYERLPNKMGDIKISFLMGMDDGYSSPNPITSEGRRNDDLNAVNYRKIRKKLIDLGFVSRVLTHDEIRKVVKADVRPLPYVEQLVQTYNGNRANRIVIDLFFGRTQINEASKGFHYYLKDGIEKSSVLMYDGHSGLGGNLFLPDLEAELKKRFVPKKEQYQIYYFNSCSSYAYYNKMFFGRKKSASSPNGTKDLDIVTTGLEAPFEGSVEVDVDFITSVHRWAKLGTVTGYAELIRRLENDDLAGVNGDEDNLKTTE